MSSGAARTVLPGIRGWKLLERTRCIPVLRSAALIRRRLTYRLVNNCTVDSSYGVKGAKNSDLALPHRCTVLCSQ